MANFGAIAGLISAALFAVPALRQELKRRDYAKFKEQAEQDSANDASIEKLKKYAETMMLRLSIRWDFWDSLCVILGIVFLALSFLVELFVRA